MGFSLKSESPTPCEFPSKRHFSKMKLGNECRHPRRRREESLQQWEEVPKLLGDNSQQPTAVGGGT